MTLSLTKPSGDIAAKASGDVTVTATLADNLPHGVDVDRLSISGVKVVASEADGESVPGQVKVTVADDVPTAIKDATTANTNTKVTYNVLTNSDGTSDIQGADGARLTAATLADFSKGKGNINSYNENGDITFTPEDGFEGDVVINYTITDADGDTSSTTLTVTVDSVPTTPPEGTDAATVDEDGLQPDGIAGGDRDVVGEATSMTDSLGYSFGRDGAGTFKWLTDGLEKLGLSSRGEDLSYEVTQDGLLLTGSAGGRTVLEVEMTSPDDLSDGDYTVTLRDVLDHPTGGIPGTEDDIVLPVKYQITDGDGSKATGTLNVTVDDDSPTASSSDLSADGTVNLVGDGGFNNYFGANNTLGLANNWYFSTDRVNDYKTKNPRAINYNEMINSANNDGLFAKLGGENYTDPKRIEYVLLEDPNYHLVGKIDGDPTQDGIQTLSAGMTYQYSFDLGRRLYNQTDTQKNFIVELYNVDAADDDPNKVMTLESDSFSTLPASKSYKIFDGEFEISETANYYIVFRTGGAKDYQHDFVVDRVAIATAGTILDEDGVPDGIPGKEENGDVPGKVTTGTGKLTFAFGADGMDSDKPVSWLADQPSLTSDDQPLTSGGEALKWTPSEDGLTLTATASSGQEVLVLELTDVDTSNGTAAYNVTLKGPLDHAIDNTEDNLEFDVRYGVTDFDGDTAVGKVRIEVDDDSPVASPDEPTETATAGMEFTYNVLKNDGFGADGQDAGGGLLSAELHDDNPDVGDVSVDRTTGEVIFIYNGTSTTGNVKINYTIRDADGDTDGDKSNAILTVKVGGPAALLSLPAADYAISLNETPLDGGNDVLRGGTGDDSLSGQAGVDTLYGGQGSNQLMGSQGADTFAWELDDAGTSGAPAEDRIQDFTVGTYGSGSDADQLDIADLLVGETDDNIGNYLYAEEDDKGNTVLHISSDGHLGDSGNNADQTITLAGVSMEGSSDSADFIQQLVNRGQLDID